MKRAHNPAAVPASPFYSQGLEVANPGRWLFVSGQVGVDSSGAVADDVGAQTRQALANLAQVLESAGLSTDDVVRMTIYLTDQADVEAFVGAAAESSPAVPPATTLLIVNALADPRLRVEIEALAATD